MTEEECTLIGSPENRHGSRRLVSPARMVTRDLVARDPRDPYNWAVRALSAHSEDTKG